MGLTMKRVTAASCATVMLLGAAACGDDDDDGDDTASAAAYCEVADELDGQDSFPSDEQFDALAAAAPDEIADEVAFVVDRIKTDGPASFADPEVVEKFEVIEEFEVTECGREPDEPIEGTSTELDPDAQRIDVSATDYDFEFDTPGAGAVSFVMSNDGDEPHFMFIARLLGGATLAEALDSEDPVEEGLAEDVGESEVVGPGGEAVLTIENLEPGEYAMACFIPTPDGVPHAFEGMAVEFTVEA